MKDNRTLAEIKASNRAKLIQSYNEDVARIKPKKKTKLA